MIAAVEDALKLELAGLVGPGPAQLRTVDSYGGQLDDVATLLASQAMRLPAVWVAFAGEGEPKPVGTSRDRWRIPMVWTLLVVTRNLRSESAARLGDAASAGAYELLEAARLVLLGSDLGLEIDNLAPGRTRGLVNGRVKNQGLAVYSQEWRTAYVLRKASGDETAAELRRIGINYHLQPDDGVADVSDLLTLQGA